MEIIVHYIFWNCTKKILLSQIEVGRAGLGKGDIDRFRELLIQINFIWGFIMRGKYQQYWDVHKLASNLESLFNYFICFL
jgi:hypothetical protein